MNVTATAALPPAARLPGPADRWWGLPLIAAMRRDYLGYCLRLKQQYGDLVPTRLLQERALDLFHPDLVREALVDHADALIRWERGPEVFAQLMGQSVLVTEGATWQRQRRTTRPIVIGGHAVPARTMLRVTPWVQHHDARWFEEPERFRPERFLPDAPPPPRGAYLPFGVGPRVCLGQHFALLEMTIVASMLLQRFTFEASKGAPMPEPRLDVTLRPATSASLRVRPRQKA
jgi:cytochrome P450